MSGVSPDKSAPQEFKKRREESPTEGDQKKSTTQYLSKYHYPFLAAFEIFRQGKVSAECNEAEKIGRR